MSKIILFLILSTTVILSPVSLAEEAKVDVIAFSRYSLSNWQIWLKNLDTREEYQLTHTPIDKRNPQWAKGGKKIFYRTANSEIYIFDIETKTAKKVLQRFGAVMDQRCSRDGSKITFARLRPDLMDDSDIWISDLSGEDARSLIDEEGLQYSPIFSPNGGEITFVSSNKEGGQTVYIMNGDGQDRRELTKGTFFDVVSDFSPDGKSILFSSNRGNDYDIWQVEVDTLRLKQLTSSSGIDTSAVFSPHGEKIAFVSSRSGTLEIWSMDKEGGSLSMITQDSEAPSQDPAWALLSQSIWQDLIKGETQSCPNSVILSEAKNLITSRFFVATLLRMAGFN